MKSNERISKMMEHPSIRNLGLKDEIISLIVSIYDSVVLDDLLENGHIELDNGMNIEIVKLLDRVHVLRGISYQSNRKYKLKLTMEDALYKRIEEYYDSLLKEIE